MNDALLIVKALNSRADKLDVTRDHLTREAITDEDLSYTNLLSVISAELRGLAAEIIFLNKRS